MTEAVNHRICKGRFDGRRALITGGASGLGFAAAARLAAEGASVGLLDRSADAVAVAAGRLRERGLDAEGFAADVTHADLLARRIEEFGAGGTIDVLVTSAGIFPRIEFDEMTLEQWSDVMEVNLAGVFASVKAVLPAMKRQGYGRIVTISSETVLSAVAAQAAYVTSKAGIIGFTRSLAREGGPHGVTANAILPGLIATEGAASMPVDLDALFEVVVDRQSVKRRGHPDDIAEAIAFLAAEGAGFITGQSLAVGGGDYFL